jgi:hypothetical protein
MALLNVCLKLPVVKSGKSLVGDVGKKKYTVPDFNSQPDKDENDPFIAKTNIWNKFQTNGKLLGGLAVLDYQT